MTSDVEGLREAIEALSADETVQGDLRAAAEKRAVDFDEATCREAAVLLLIDGARYRWRLRNLERERAAEREAYSARLAAEQQTRKARTAEMEATKGFGHGSTNKRNPCHCEICDAAFREVHEIEADIRRRHVEEMGKMIDKFKSMLRIEWTNELLEAGFALPDGSIRTWRDATIGEHRERFEMLQTNAIRNAEAAARHSAAITTIEAAGADTLGQALTTNHQAAA